MDELDRKILNLLTEDARMSNTELAKALNLSESAVRYRIKNLEKNEVLGYTTVLRDENKVRCLINLEVNAQTNVAKFYPSLKELTEVNEVLETSGTFDAVLFCSFQTVDEMNSFVDEVRAKKEVKSTDTVMVLKKW